MPEPPSVVREVERKLRVAPEFVVLDLVGLGLVARVVPGQPFQMTAVYHDTPDLRLLRWGATLRRREGGPDEGWHLKLPVHGADRGTRDEVHLPLWAGSAGAVPAELADIVAPLTRGERLVPLAQVRTLRAPSALVDRDGAEVAELVDDQVEVRDQHGRILAAFRELEVEAGDAAAPDAQARINLVDRIAEALVDQGAQRSEVSKAAAALGAQAGAPPDLHVDHRPTPDEPARQALRSIIALHARHLVLADVGVRRGLPDSVHQLRVAARRLRSTLRTLEPLLEADWARTLEEELAWLASELGLVRDTEVLAARLARQAASLGEPDASLVSEAIDPFLARRLEGARGSALAALRTERHDLLLDDLVRGAQDPPVTALATQPSGEVMPALAERTWQRLRRAARRLGPHDSAEDWHRVRIRAKRARYALESIEPLLDERGHRLARRLAEVTDVLGGLQDAHLAQGVLLEMANRDGTTLSTAFALGRLAQQQEFSVQRQRAEFARIWPGVRQAAKQARWD